MSALLKFKTPPRAHQREALRLMQPAPAFSLMMGVGTGKSYCIVNDILQQRADVAVIVAPPGVHEDTWQEAEIPRHWSGTSRPMVRITKAGKPMYGLRDLIENSEGAPVRIACVHYNALITKTGRDAIVAFLRTGRRTYMALDESHNIKTPKSKTTRAAWQLAKFADVRRILSGTMTTHGYEDLYAQYRFLDWRIIGARTFTEFKAEHCDMRDQTIYKKDGSTIVVQRIAGYRNEEALFRKIAPYTFQIHKEDCLDLPPQTWVERTVALSREQQRLYDDLVKYAVAQTEAGKLVNTEQTITLLIRLQQIVSGHVGTGEGQWEPVACPRIEACVDTVRESDGKVLVWARWIPDRIQLKKAFDDAGIGARVYAEETRQDALSAFRRDPGIKVLLLNPATGGAGLTINEAPNAVHYSLSFAWVDLVQSEGRNHRDGQTVPVTYTTLRAKGTTDDHIQRILRLRQDVADAVRTAPELRRVLGR